jgi:hypothetical protein
MSKSGGKRIIRLFFSFVRIWPKIRTCWSMTKKKETDRHRQLNNCQIGRPKTQLSRRQTIGRLMILASLSFCFMPAVINTCHTGEGALAEIQLPQHVREGSVSANPSSVPCELGSLKPVAVAVLSGWWTMDVMRRSHTLNAHSRTASRGFGRSPRAPRRRRRRRCRRAASPHHTQRTRWRAGR